MIVPPYTDSDWWASYFQKVFILERCQAVPIELDAAPPDIIMSFAVRAIYIAEGRWVIGRTVTRYFAIEEPPRPEKFRCWVALDLDLFLGFVKSKLPGDVLAELLRGIAKDRLDGRVQRR